MAQFKNILFILGDADPNEGLQRAIALAAETDATLTLTSVVATLVSAPQKGRFHDELTEAFEALRAKRLDELKTLSKTVPSRIETVCEILDGSLPLEIVRRVISYDHDLVVMQATSQSGPLRRVFASEDMQLLRKCPVPLLLLKPGQASAFKQVLAAIDFDRDDVAEEDALHGSLNQRILDLAAILAHDGDGTLHVANIYEVPGEGAMVAGWIPTAPDALSDYSDRCRETAQSRVDAAVDAAQGRHLVSARQTDAIKTHIVKGRARDDIPRLANEVGADLVVMGTVGRVGVPGLLIGNTAETILGALECSVLALKPEGFKTPVMPN